MPYKNIENKLVYNKGYKAGIWKATREHLGNRCVICGTTDNLQIHHKNGLNRKARTEKDLFNLEEIELRCKEHHN